MKNGADPRVRTPDLGLALQALHGAGYLDATAFEVFNEGYGFLRQLEQRIVVRSGSERGHYPGGQRRARSPGATHGLSRRPGRSRQ